MVAHGERVVLAVCGVAVSACWWSEEFVIDTITN